MDCDDYWMKYLGKNTITFLKNETLCTFNGGIIQINELVWQILACVWILKTVI